VISSVIQWDEAVRQLSHAISTKDAVWTLVYTTTIDGFDAKRLNEACAGKKTVYLMQTTDGQLAAAYNVFSAKAKDVSTNWRGFVARLEFDERDPDQLDLQVCFLRVLKTSYFPERNIRTGIMLIMV
jgi:hypothetical protein